MNAQTEFVLDKHPLPASVLADLERAVAYFDAHTLPFSIEGVRDRLSNASRDVLASPLHKNALGGFVQGLVRSGQYVPSGIVAAQRENARGRMLRVWKRRAA